MEKTDITIIGAGVVGLAIAYVLSEEGKEVIVVEKHNSFGQETSSRNSEVIHAGLYYPKNSLKANLCIRGKDLLYELCRNNNIGYKRLGKLIVGSEKDEISNVEGIYKNALECGAKNLRLIDRGEIVKLEPNVTSQMALFSPDTGIVDSHGLMKFFYEKAKDKKCEFAFGVEAVGIEKKSSGYRVTVSEPQGELFQFESRVVINSAGLGSDKVAALAGIDVDKYGYKLQYNKGQYFRISNPKEFNITRLVYPPPTKTDLGIHITPDLAGGLRLGPDANYVDKIDYNVAEESKPIFYKSVSKYLSGLNIDDLVSDTSGIRPKTQGPKDEIKDFIISNESDKGLNNFINLIGIESPGLTASLAIAEEVKKIIRTT